MMTTTTTTVVMSKGDDERVMSKEEEDDSSTGGGDGTKDEVVNAVVRRYEPSTGFVQPAEAFMHKKTATRGKKPPPGFDYNNSSEYLSVSAAAKPVAAGGRGQGGTPVVG